MQETFPGRWVGQENPYLYFRPETAFFYEVKANIDSFSSFRPVLPYPPQEMLDFQLFNQVITNSQGRYPKKNKIVFLWPLVAPFNFPLFCQVPVLIGGTSGEAATLMKYFLTKSTNSKP